MTSCSAGAALVCYMVSSVEGEGKIEGYHGVYGGKLQRVYIEDGWQGHMVQSSTAQAGWRGAETGRYMGLCCGLCYYGAGRHYTGQLLRVTVYGS